MYPTEMGWVEKVKHDFSIARNSTTIKFVPTSSSNLLSFEMALSENFSNASDTGQESWEWEHLDISLEKCDIWKPGHLDVSLDKPDIPQSRFLISDPTQEENSVEERSENEVRMNPVVDTASDNIESSQLLLGESIKIEIDEPSYLFEVNSGLNLIKCEICTDQFTAKADLKKHTRLVHPIPKEKDFLDDCITENLALTPIGRVFTVYEHEVYLTASGKFKCPAPLCEKACTRGKVLRVHVRKEHSDIFFKGFHYCSKNIISFLLI